MPNKLLMEDGLYLRIRNIVRYGANKHASSWSSKVEVENALTKCGVVALVYCLLSISERFKRH